MAYKSKWTNEITEKVKSYIASQGVPPRSTQIAVHIGVSEPTLFAWAAKHKDLAEILGVNKTARLDYETEQLIAGKIQPHVYKLLAEYNHGLISEYQRQVLEIKRQELAAKIASGNVVQDNPQPIQIQFAIKSERSEG